MRNVRTDRYSADDIETIWLTTNHARWLYQLPSMRVVQDGQEGWMVDRGMATWEHHCWRGGGRRRLGTVVDGVLKASVVHHEVTGLTEAVIRGAGTIELCHVHAIALVSSGTLADEARFECQQAAARKERERHQRRIEALWHRQAAVLPTLVGDAFHAASPGQGVFVGVRGVRVVPGRLPDQFEARGNEKTALGVVAWIGSRRCRHLLGIGSPVLGRINPGLARSWASRGVKVYAVDIAEKVHLERALDGAVTVRMADPRPGQPRPIPGTVSPRSSSRSRG